MSTTRTDRRDFLKLALTSAAYASIAGPLLLSRKPAWARNFSGEALNSTDPASPIRFVDSPASTDFNGDEMDRAHEILWDKAGYIKSRGGYPEISERVHVAVVGGGMAGLTAAYRLREFKPVLLEQASQFGGNSKGENWRGSQYSIGAAYLAQPDEGDPSLTLLRELGLESQVRQEVGEGGMVFWDGRLTAPFWAGVTDPERADEFKRAWELFARVRENEFPDIPCEVDSQISRDRLLALDSISLTEWMQRELGEVHPHIAEFVTQYCWSSFGGDPTEISAAQGLNFLASDLGGTYVLPGGNAAVARAIHERLKEECGSDHLRAGALVVDVAPFEDGVRICYETADGRFVAMHAQTCIVALPKFVAQFVVTGLPQSQLEAMRKIRYRAYIVSNVLLNRRIESPCYDLFSINGTVAADPKEEVKKHGFTDVCFGSWAGGDNDAQSVLTLYRPLPYDGSRPFLFSPFAHDKHKQIVERSLQDTLAALGLGSADVAGIRMTRWGHAIPLAATGLIASGLLEKASKPVADRIFFAQQDCWANPCIETAIGTAEIAATHVAALLTQLL